MQIDFVFAKDWIPSKEVLSIYKKSFDNVYYQLDTTEYSYDATDAKCLEDTKKYIDVYGSGGLDPILLTDSYYIHQSDYMVKKTLNIIDFGASYMQSKEQCFRPVEKHYDKMASLFVDEEIGFFEDIFFDAVKNTMSLDFRP